MTEETTDVLLQQRPLGATGLLVPPLCIGTAELGDLKNFPYAVGEERAVATARAIFEGPIRFVDTAGGYGESERRLGIAVRERGGLPAGFVLSTKVGCHLAAGEPGGDHVRRSIERSLRLLGLNRLQLVFVHDPEALTFEQVMEPGGVFATLSEYKDQGVIEHLGVAGGPIDLMTRLLETGGFEVVLTHNRYTLLNVAAGPLLAVAAHRGVGVLNGAVYGGGILGKGPDVVPRYAYRAASPNTLERARRIVSICARYDVPLAAAAVQFSLHEPRIASTVVGISRPERVAETVALASHPIPCEAWLELEAVVPETGDFRSW
jgi:D-threo-aldose 1-dehydrogenase